MSTSPEVLFSRLLETGVVDAALDSEFPFYPLDSPDMSLPGPNFSAAAQAAGGGDGDAYLLLLHYLYRRALYDGQFQLPIVVRGQYINAPFVQGHLRDGSAAGWDGGPRCADVMIIGKCPGTEEVGRRANFVGPTSDVLFRGLTEAGIDSTELASWYLTNLIRWPQLDRRSDTLPAAWRNDCLPLLEQELRLVRPKYILCLGSDASNALLGAGHSVQSMVGRVASREIQRATVGGTSDKYAAAVVTVVHPAAVYRKPELYEEFVAQLQLLVRCIRGEQTPGVEQLDHQCVYKEAQLARIVDAVRADRSRWLIAVDAEWHGRWPGDAGAFLRTVQFSTRHGEGITVVLRHQRGVPAFVPTIDRAIVQLRRLLKYDGEYRPRIGGHFFRSDLARLLAEGLDLREEYAPAGSSEAAGGGWDTSLMAHAHDETSAYKLEELGARLVGTPRYDTVIQKRKEVYCREQDIKVGELEGFGDFPDWELHPYACFDPDVTRRLAVRYLEPGGLLDRDRFGNSSRVPAWRAHRASLAFLEMELTGIMLDRDRVDELVRTFVDAYAVLLQNFRTAAHWPEFNPMSHTQCAAFLFGDRIVSNAGVRPAGALTLDLPPVKTTGRRSKSWEAVEYRREEDVYAPSTDKEVLGILGQQHPLAMQLRDIRFIGHTLTSVLRRPDCGPDGQPLQHDGHYVYSGGIAGYANDDGRIRTRMSQVKETGRSSSASPPLQNISKRRESDYARILGYYPAADGVPRGDYLQVFPAPLYRHPIRSILRASPGHVLVECDYTGAELAVLAWLADDETMIEHVRRNSLPESDPAHYDIHSQTAVSAFQLSCPPTKRGLDSAGLSALRVAAKNVNFGIPYGRGAAAIARQCREEGTDITEENTQQIIDFYYSQYPNTAQLLAECRRRVSAPGWIVTPFGRRRRFRPTTDQAVLGEQERQAQNFPIQSTVADAVNIALYNLYNYHRTHSRGMYRILLQIHDAVLCEVPIAELEEFVHVVLPVCMVEQVPVWPTTLAGAPMQGKGPYYFGIDTEISANWGEKLSPEQAELLGIPPSLL